MSRRNFVNKRMTEETLEAIPNTEPAADTADSAANSAEAKALPDAAAISQEEFDRLKAERDSLLDRLARLQAEFENARKREARERNDFRD